MRVTYGSKTKMLEMKLFCLKNETLLAAGALPPESCCSNPKLFCLASGSCQLGASPNKLCFFCLNLNFKRGVHEFFGRFVRVHQNEKG